MTGPADTVTGPADTVAVLADRAPHGGRPEHNGVVSRPERSDASSRRWERVALLALLAVTAAGYLWDLSASGYANSFYAAAVQAGTESWKAFFFGSLDRSNFITVDKPPASLWIMDLSGRIFGFSSWSLLAPQAVEGVAAVGLLYASVRRWFGAPAGLLAGAVLAVTPVAALMFRFDNPDALLVLLLVAAAYTLTRATEHGRTRWLVATGALLGFAFLAKMLEAFTVLPAFGAVYLLAAPVTFRRRIAQLAIGAGAIVVSAGWWVAAVALWPVADRPMVDGSPDNSIINLIFGYNGLDRLSASSGPGGNFSGTPGLFRLFNDLMGGQASWLLPAALLVVVAGAVAAGRSPRTDRTRAALILWGGWLVVTGLIFSLGGGIIHTYYTVALAPAIAALVGIGAALLWRHRQRGLAWAAAAVTVEVTAIWAYVLLDRTPSYHPELRAVIVATGTLAAAGLAGSGLLRAGVVGAGLGGRLRSRLAAAVCALAIASCLAGPAAYAATTVTTAHTGSVPSAGPSTTTGGLGGAGGPGGTAGGGAPGASRSLPTGSRGSTPLRSRQTPPGGSHGAGTRHEGAGTRPENIGAGAPGHGQRAANSGGRTDAPGDAASAGSAASRGGGAGQTVTSALASALRADATSYRWVAAVFGSQDAATIELSTNEPVMAIGGFDGEGGHLSLTRFEAYVRSGDIHYFIDSGTNSGIGGDSNFETAISRWVAAHYHSETIGGQTVYDLAARK